MDVSKREQGAMAPLDFHALSPKPPKFQIFSIFSS